MINSITFDTTKKSNYILDKLYKDVLKKGKTEEAYKNAIQEYENTKHDIHHCRKYFSKNDIYDDFYEEVEDGYKNIQLINNLKDKTFTFSKSKINLIFGPNASGKTTILKAISANTLCGDSLNLDGFTNPNMFEPLDLSIGSYTNTVIPYQNINNEWVLKSQEDYNIMYESLLQKINRKAGNNVILDWDGALVYYENFANRIRTGSCNDFVGTIMGSFAEAVSYNVYSHEASLGQQTGHMLLRLLKIIKQLTTTNTQQIIDNTLNDASVNEYWYNAKRVQCDYLEKYINYDKHVPTLLLDELDKSLDILNVISLYKNILPDIIHKNDIQLIIISHNPIVLSSLLSEDDYNIISLDPEYTETVRKQLVNCKF